jgi:hypothetical protein
MSDFTNILETLSIYAIRATAVLWFLGTAFVLVWYFKSYKKLIPLEDEIRKLKHDIDNMENTIHQKTRGTISQSVLDGRVAREKIPLQARMEQLELERRFILEKLPLVGILKR